MSLEMVPGEKIIDQNNNSIENEKEYNFEEVSNLKKQVINLVEQLKTSIEVEEYTTLIGDDASGRIPALILKKISESITGNPIKLLFIAGGKGTWWDPEKIQNTEHKINNIKEYIKGRVLFVTEFMGKGEGMVNMAEQLEKYGIDFDIASVASRQTKDSYEENFEILKRHKLIIGEAGIWGAPSVYNEDDLAGVKKWSPSDASAKRIDVYSTYGRRITNARRDVDLLAKEVVEEVWEEEIKKAA